MAKAKAAKRQKPEKSHLQHEVDLLSHPAASLDLRQSRQAIAAH
jgi:hypothetical protein